VVVVIDMMLTFLSLRASGQLCIRQLIISDLVDLKICIHSTLKSGDECMKFSKVNKSCSAVKLIYFFAE